MKDDDIDWVAFRYECGQVIALGIPCVLVVFAILVLISFLTFMGKGFVSIILVAFIITIAGGSILRYGFNKGKKYNG